MNPYLEDDMNMSSISFNSRILDQFKSIGDSVSQIGAGDTYQHFDDLNPPPLDLGQINIELKLREEKIKSLTSDKTKLK